MIRIGAGIWTGEMPDDESRGKQLVVQGLNTVGKKGGTGSMPWWKVPSSLLFMMVGQGVGEERGRSTAF